MKNATEIVVVADRSGSMFNIAEDMMGGFNEFIKKQKTDPTECHVTLALFDDRYDVVYERCSLPVVPELTREIYFARGATALNDAIGRTIASTGERLAGLKEEDRPNKIIFMILTDGEENASSNFSGEKVREMIKHQQEKYNWQFIFLGVDVDAYHMGNQYGIPVSNTISSTKGSLRNVYKAYGASVANSRNLSIDNWHDGASTTAFTDEQKEEAGDVTATKADEEE